MQIAQLRFRQTTEHLVEAVVVPLRLAMQDHPRTFEKVRGHSGVYQRAGIVEEDAVVLAKARRVVVPHRNRVAKRLQDGLRLQNPMLDACGCGIAGARDEAQVLHHNLRRLRLPSTALPRNDEALVLALAHQSPVGGIRDCIRMRRQCSYVLPAISGALVTAVKPFYVVIRVHSQQHAGGVGINLIRLVSKLEVLQDRSIIEVHQRSVVLAALAAEATSQRGTRRRHFNAAGLHHHFGAFHL
mmetsp:Transcript_24972/g.59366  ORF Transcript_24972/g.59366 Transcript_24972/m.59366 type:complete len:242 (+) Transcript_24972:690-1415(+)